MLGVGESDKILLIRRHRHLIRPLENNEPNMRRAFTHGTVTRFYLVVSLLAGYAYAKLQKDEVVRRKFYCHYANTITFFDAWSPIFERQLIQCAHWFRDFDSTHAFWHYKTTKLAEYRAYRKLEPQILQK